MRRLWFALLAVGFTAAIGKADLVTIEPSNHPQPGGEANVLFNQPGMMNNGLTVQGAIQPGFVLDFTANEALMTPATPAAGMGMIMAADGGGFTALSVHDRTGVFFNGFSFDVHTLNNASGALTIMVNLLNGGPAAETFKLGAGNNFFTILAASGQEITDVKIASSVSLRDIDQERISGVGRESSSVPEPSSLLLLGSGLLGLATSLRRFI